MCGMCARMVVAPRPRVPVPVQPMRPAVAVPVTGPIGQPMSAAVPGNATPGYPGLPGEPYPQGPATSPWVRRASGISPAEPPRPAPSHDSGLLSRGVHAEAEG
jgi:hypothetical protein